MIKKLFLVGVGIAALSTLRAESPDDPWGQGPAQGQGQGGSQQQQQRMMRPPMMGGGGSAIVVSDGAIFVVSQGMLYRFEEKSLKQEAKVPLPSNNNDSSTGHGGAEPQQNQQGNSPGGQGGPGQGGPGGQGGPPMMMGGGGVALTAANGSVYVVSQGKLYKFDSKTLYFQTSIDVGSKDDRKNPGSSPGGQNDQRR